MNDEDMRDLRALLIKAIDDDQIQVGEGLVRCPAVAMEYKAKTRVVLLKLGRPL